MIILRIQWSVAVLMLVGCQNLKPENIELPKYPDLEKVYIEQCNTLGSQSLQKEVFLDSEVETNFFSMDSSSWKKELYFLKELNPNRPEYVGIFKKIESRNELKLRLIEGEKGLLKNIDINYEGESYSKISATIHEDKDVFAHHRDIEVYFENGLINSWDIRGYQKMLFKDTIRFEIRGKLITKD